MSEQELILNGEIKKYDPFRAQLTELAEKNAMMVFDYATEEGAKEAGTHIKTLKKTKTAIEKVRKEEKKQSLDYGRLVDGEAKEIAEKIDEMVAIHQTPLDEIAEQETLRKATLMERVAEIRDYFDESRTNADEIKKCIDMLEQYVIDDSYEEAKPHAALAKEETLQVLREQLETVIALEAEAKRLAELEEKARVEREEKIRLDAEAKAKADAEAAHKAEIARIEKEKQDAIEAEKAAAKKREEDAKLAAEKAERGRLEAEQKKLDDEAKERAAEEKRQANKKHREKIEHEIIGAFQQYLSPIDSENLLGEMKAGKIPHVTINY